MEDVRMVDADDSYKDCKRLSYSITETEFMLNNTHKREKFPFAFMSYPVCIPGIIANAVQSRLILEDRLGYLAALYRQKQCALQEQQKEYKPSKPKESFIINKTNLLPIGQEPIIQTPQGNTNSTPTSTQKAS